MRGGLVGFVTVGMRENEVRITPISLLVVMICTTLCSNTVVVDVIRCRTRLIAVSTWPGQIVNKI